MTVCLIKTSVDKQDCLLVKHSAMQMYNCHVVKGFCYLKKKTNLNTANLIAVFLIPRRHLWGQHIKTQHVRFTLVTTPLFFPCISLSLPLGIFVSVWTPKCRLMPCRTDRLNANPCVVPKTALGSFIVRVRACVCARVPGRLQIHASMSTPRSKNNCPQ